MKNHRNPVVVTMVALLIMAFLTSCNVRNANGGNQQRPMFAPASGSPIALGCGPGNIAIGDLNKDSKPDLIAGCEQTRTVTVLLGTGAGGFRVSQPTPLPDAPGNVVLGDVNGDGNPDLAIDSHDSYGVILMLGDGKGNLAVASNSPIVMKEGTQPHTHGLGLADVNGDGKPDLITANNADNDISVAFGDGRGGFTRAAKSFAVGPSPYPFTLGDVNNDRRPDVIATASATGPQRAQQLRSSFALTLLLNDGGGGFRRSDLPLRTGQPWFAAIGDVNGDGKADVVATHHDQSKLTLLLGEGAGQFREHPNSPFDFGRQAFQVALEDVNRDGRIDALAAMGGGVHVMLGDGRGNFRAAPASPVVAGQGVWRFAISDLNADGKFDLVTSNLESRSVSVLLGQ